MLRIYKGGEIDTQIKYAKGKKKKKRSGGGWGGVNSFAFRYKA